MLLKSLPAMSLLLITFFSACQDKGGSNAEATSLPEGKKFLDPSNIADTQNL